MLNDKRIEEVAHFLLSRMSHIDQCKTMIEALKLLPEFQSPPKSEWIEWGGNTDLSLMREILGSNQKHLWRGCDNVRYAKFHEIVDQLVITHVLIVPPYVPPESPLVRKFREKFAASKKPAMYPEEIVEKIKECERDCSQS